MDDLFRIGQITSAHGIRGDVKVFPVTSEPDRFLDMDKVLLAREGEEEHVTEYEITKASHFKNLILLHLKGVEDRNQAEALAGFSLWVTREDALPLEEDEYFFKDLLDCQVFDESGAKVGTVSDVMETGANDVLVVEDAEGKELLLPIIEDCILEIDVEEKRILMRWMEGLK